MNTDALMVAREYYDKVTAGGDRKKVAKDLGVTIAIERSPEYRAIITAMADLERDQLKYELEMTKRRQLHAYTKLLDKGEELMEQAKTTEEMIKAQSNQRANLQSGVVDDAATWEIPSTNTGNVLDGVVIP